MTHRRMRSLAIALAATTALASPAMGQDLRTPDAVYPVGQPSVAGADLRSPDAVDPVGSSTVANVVPIEAPAAVAVPSLDSGFDWADAGLGAGMAIALLLGLGGSVAVRRHHHRTALG